MLNYKDTYNDVQDAKKTVFRMQKSDNQILLLEFVKQSTVIKDDVNQYTKLSETAGKSIFVV